MKTNARQWRGAPVWSLTLPYWATTDRVVRRTGVKEFLLGCMRAASRQARPPAMQAAETTAAEPPRLRSTRARVTKSGK